MRRAILPVQEASMQLKEMMAELEKRGSESIKKTLQRHGAPNAMFGVKVGDMKVLMKKAGKDHALALALWDTGNADAMYLAGLMADAQQITAKELERWAKNSTWQMLSEYSVAGVAADSPHGPALARKWIDDKQEKVASAGWSTWCGVVAVRPDSELDLKELEGLLARVEKEVQAEKRQRVRYTMNAFVTAVGCAVAPLSKRAMAAAKKIGPVEVDMGDTDCRVHVAADMIAKVAGSGRAGKKRKSARC
jgi:3-methyladenine DNA glycosylase AlkD